MPRASSPLIAIFLAFAPAAAVAQSVDGFSSIQAIPVVVDSASFAQRFSLNNKNDSSVDVLPYYFPAVGTTQATSLDCPPFTLEADSKKTFASLRAVCPALGAGSQFGTLVFHAPGFATFSAFSRVSNPQGAGFSVEAFPASSFTSGKTVATGLRRLSATAGAPAYQTNCFVGVLKPYRATGTAVSVHYALRDGASAQIGSGDLVVQPGTLVRLLDVFTAAGAAAGDHDDASVEFDATQQYFAFCTVQDNTSFGADFRIAKSADGINGTAGRNLGVRDLYAPRDLSWGSDSLGRAFAIPPGQFINTHLLHVHVPDYVQCELVNGVNQRLAPSFGLELRARLLGSGLTWGGNDSVVIPDPAKFNLPYNGDREEWAGNPVWVLEVESNGQNEAANRPYRIRCRSGSGTSPPQILEYQRAGSDF